MTYSKLLIKTYGQSGLLDAFGVNPLMLNVVLEKHSFWVIYFFKPHYVEIRYIINIKLYKCKHSLTNKC